MNERALDVTRSEQPILAGLYLSKFDKAGLKRLGFDGFTEAFNVLGYAVGSPPASIKNYRDEFDPLFANARKGWHKRPTRDHCLKVLNDYKDLDIELFSQLIISLTGSGENAWSEVQGDEEESEDDSCFAKRLITGLAAERYFETIHQALPEFQGWAAENTTRHGCGFDFRLKSAASDEFLAVEVKGLKGRTGSVSLTQKEHRVATALGDRFFLFVVKNFRESPFHEMHRNPLSGGLRFERSERKVIQISWLANV
jgi:hypothetical protein